MIRRLINRSFDGLFVEPLAFAMSRRLRGRILCLIYHRVSDEVEGFLEWGGVPSISTRELRRDLMYLKERGGAFFTFHDLREGRKPAVDAPNFIVSFDDGFRDTYEQGLPVLDELGIPGVVFQVSELVGGRDLNWEHLLYLYAYEPKTRDLLGRELDSMGSLPIAIEEKVKTARDTLPTERLVAMLADVRDRIGDQAKRQELARKLYPSADNIVKATQNGHEIGSHGARHIARRFLSDEEFSNELVESSRAISKILHEPPRAYAYPFGCHEAGDSALLSGVYDQAVLATPGFIDTDASYSMPRCPWPGPARNELRRRRWLLTGQV